MDGRLKLNVDAVLKICMNSFSVSMLLRNHLGEFIQALCYKRDELVSVSEAEVWVVLEALKWI